MEEENITSITFHGNNKVEEEDTNVPLPGFRFHPTDEELVGFYLRRKVENKKINLELIKTAEIYKHDPWDLPKLCNSVGDKEWYFYCKRGRKYKNSVRPNRVTSSGFWKATGIDKPVYSSGDDRCIIGLKKSLVYYRGSSGKGTKTDWMMHEFRLPPSRNVDNNATNTMIDARTSINTHDQEAEVWTLCRVFKRNATTSNYKKFVSDSRQTASINHSKRSVISHTTTAASRTCSSIESSDDDGHHMNYISFDTSNDPVMNVTMRHVEGRPYAQYFPENSSSSSAITQYDLSFAGDHFNDMLSHGIEYNWEDLRSLVSCDTVCVNPSFYV